MVVAVVSEGRIADTTLTLVSEEERIRRRKKKIHTYTTHTYDEHGVEECFQQTSTGSKKGIATTCQAIDFIGCRRLLSTCQKHFSNLLRLLLLVVVVILLIIEVLLVGGLHAVRGWLGVDAVPRDEVDRELVDEGFELEPVRRPAGCVSELRLARRGTGPELGLEEWTVRLPEGLRGASEEPGPERDRPRTFSRGVGETVR